MSARFLLAEIRLGLRRNLTLTLAVVISVAVSLSLLGVALLIGRQIEVNKDYWYDRAEVSVFLCGAVSAVPTCPDGKVSDAQRADIEARLRALPEVRTVSYESSQEAYDRARTMPGMQAISDSVTPDTLPESFRIKLTDPQQYDAISRAVADQPGVETVQDQKQLLDPLLNLLGKLRAGALLFALVQLAASALLVANTIRLAALNRRRETGIMRLVGASRTAISLPFLLEGALSGLLGAVAACAVLAAGYQLLVVGWLAPRLPIFAYIGWGDVVATLPVLLLLGLLLAGLTSLLSLARHVRV